MKPSREERLRDLMNKAASGKFSINGSSPEETQRIILDRLQKASEVPPEDQEKLAQARLDDAKDVPKAIRALNVLEAMNGAATWYEYTPGSKQAEAAAEDDCEISSFIPNDVDIDSEDGEIETSAPASVNRNKMGPK